MRPVFNTKFGIPGPPKDKILDISRLDGGMNTWELDYRIDANQSPDMENMYWVDGALGSRKGQEYLNETALGGPVYATYEREFQNVGVVHAGTKIYTINLDTGVATERYTAVTAQRGTFFAFEDDLYYLNGAEYLKMLPDLSVAPVVPYIPVVAMNRNPDGTGGDLYQPENRLAPGKEVWFTADGTSKDYYLPYKGLDATLVTATVNGVDKVETTDFTVDRTLGIVTFTTAPAKLTPAVPNGVKIKCYKADADTQNSILSCRHAIVYGGDTDLAVVVGGPTKQPNAYFWSGSHSVLDPTYFPFDYYNFAGSDATDYITGFGRQQNMLVIFKSRSIGKAYTRIETIAERDYVSLPYTLVNDRIGCDLPYTIQLVQNNLVFCNTESGPHMLLDTTNAGENNVAPIGRNINGTDSRPGLLADVRKVSAAAVSSYDDGQRYWLVASDNAYIWDYGLSPYRGAEEKLSWFYFTNIPARAWLRRADKWFYGTATGMIVKESDEYVDFGLPITRRFQFATQFFDTYEVFKDVVKVIFAVRSDTNTVINIRYETDYESREDLTPIRAYSYQLSPRNLAYRILSTIRYAMANVRTPNCKHIRHFAMVLTNSEPYTDMSLIGAQIFYRYSGGDR